MAWSTCTSHCGSKLFAIGRTAQSCGIRQSAYSSIVRAPSITNARPVTNMLTSKDSTAAAPSLTSKLTLVHVAATAFMALFSIVGFALYGLPFFYDFMVRDFGWSRAQVTSGNAISKLLVGPLFGFIAGWIVDRFGPRRLMLVGILMAGGAL